MSPEIVQRLIARPDLVEAAIRRKSQPLYTYFATTTDRQAYHKHLEFFAAGSTFRERALLGGNRVGKTVAGAYELACHLTGAYPAWWTGRRFAGPIKAWAAGDTSKTVRDILQAKLLGDAASPRGGMIPEEAREQVIKHRGLAEAVETVHVRHVHGGLSVLQLKSYDQRRESFQGTEQDVIWLDEECPRDIYTECLTRTMTSNGLIILTFTPLMGLSEVVQSFLPGGSPDQCPNHKFVVMIGWDDAAHLGADAKAAMLASYPEYQRAARSQGIPQLGSGAIYTVPADEFLVDDFAIPDHWRRCSGTDVGWQAKTTVWLAVNPSTDVAYVVDVFKRAGIEPDVHKGAVRSRGDWIPGVIDPSAIYRDLGVPMDLADNDVEKGIYEVYCRLTTGRLKLFRSCSREFLDEYRIYRRDEKGRVFKPQNDHIMDAMRYAVLSGIPLAKPKPAKRQEPERGGNAFRRQDGGWMQ